MRVLPPGLGRGMGNEETGTRNGNEKWKWRNGNEYTFMYTSWCSLGKSHSVHYHGKLQPGLFWIHFCLGLSLSDGKSVLNISP